MIISCKKKIKTATLDSLLAMSLLMRSPLVLRSLKRVLKDAISCHMHKLFNFSTKAPVSSSYELMVTSPTQTTKPTADIRGSVLVSLRFQLLSVDAREHLCSLQLFRHSPCRLSQIRHKTSARSTTWNV